MIPSPKVPNSSHPSGLPDFENPPVAEVVLDVTVDPLPLLRNAHLGMLWTTHFRDEYPKLEEHEPVVSVEETFGSPEVAFDVQRLGAPPVIRQWFISSDETRLVQVQSDRLIHNWRRRPDGGAYPRYPSLREAFERHYAAYVQFLQKEELGSPQPRQAEITYVNRLEAGQGWATARELDRVLRVWRPDFGQENLVVDELEDVRVAWRYTITDNEGPYARLYVSVEPAIGGDLVLTLKVRGRPRVTAPDGLVGFFDMGRARIVNAFAAVTTDRMHAIWGRRNG
ncbi:MAG TPA: TIGR04255 family protein [Acidimicrobiales bacterium]